MQIKTTFKSSLIFVVMNICIFSFCMQQIKANNDSTQIGNTYAIIMGISSYPYIRPLNYADKDAELFRDFLQSPGGGNVKAENIFFLENEDAKAANFWIKGLGWLQRQNLQKGDRLYLYFAGHGDAINKDEYFFLTYDCNPAGDKNNYLVTGNIQLYNLKSRIAAYSHEGIQVILIMDACRSNELPGGSEGQQDFSAAVAEKRAGELIMLSASSGQEALEDRSIGTGHGLFTYYLVDGLYGSADSDRGNKDGKIDFDELEDWLRPKVRTIAEHDFNHDQVPFFCCSSSIKQYISFVDSSSLKRWTAIKKARETIGGAELTSMTKKSRDVAYMIDSNAINIYNAFSKAVESGNLIGDSSAEYYYLQLLKKFPGLGLTQDAKYALVSEFINFAQSKINLYLAGKDLAYIEHFAADSGVSANNVDRSQTLTQMRIVVKEKFSRADTILEKAWELLKITDSTAAKALEPKLYFFKSRSYLEKIKVYPYIFDEFVWDLKSARLYLDTAIRFAIQARTLDSNAAYISHTLGLLYSSSAYTVKFYDIGDPDKRYDSAIYYELLATKQAPDWREPYNTLGVIYQNLLQEKKATTYFKTALTKDENFELALYHLGLNYFWRKMEDSANFYFDQVLKFDTLNPSVFYYLGSTFMDKMKYDSAIIFFVKALKTPDNAFAHSSVMSVPQSLYSSGQYELAEQFYHTFKDVVPPNSKEEIYDGLGKTFSMQKQYDSSIFYFRLSKNFALMFNQLGQKYFTQKNHDSSIHYLNRQVKECPFYPTNAEAYYLIARNYHQQLKLDSAMTFLEISFGKRIKITRQQVIDDFNSLVNNSKFRELIEQYFTKNR